VEFGIWSNGFRRHTEPVRAYEEDLREIIIADELGFREAWISDLRAGAVGRLRRPPLPAPGQRDLSGQSTDTPAELFPQFTPLANGISWITRSGGARMGSTVVIQGGDRSGWPRWSPRARRAPEQSS
jgi:hypothetical protein